MYLYTIYDYKKKPRMPQTAKVKVESKKKFLRIFINGGISPPLKPVHIERWCIKGSYFIATKDSGASQLSQLIRSYAAILPSPETILLPLDMI